MTTIYANWGEARVKLTWNRDTKLPLLSLITSVHGFCFYRGKLLLVNLNHRGWDFPGGHIESEETPEECFKREAMEEGYVKGECQLIGCVIVDHSENPKWDKDSPYPKIGYQVFYRMNVEQLYDFEAEYESAERMFIQPSQVADYYHDWHELYQVILNDALSMNFL